MSYQVLARKYRPQSFEDVIGQEHITRTLKNAVESGRIAHGFLFSGMRGVGKTTMARILAKALNCEKGPTLLPCNACSHCLQITQGNAMDVIEIDGASNTGVDDIRELRENVLYAPASTRYKIYIIDEVHMLSKFAFNALLKTLEEPPPHVIFVFATTEPQKVPVTIQSRCQCFQFRSIPVQNITDHILRISEQEGFAIDRDSARLIARASEGSMRDAQSLLDQILSFCGDKITVADIKLVLGVIDPEVLDECTLALIEQDAERIMNLVERLHSLGVDLVEFCRELQLYFRNLLMIKILKSPNSVIHIEKEEVEKLRPISEKVEEDRLLAFIEYLSKTEEEIRRSTHPRIVLEVALLKMTRIKPLLEFREILDQIEGLEKKLRAGDAGSGRTLIQDPPADKTYRASASSGHKLSEQDPISSRETSITLDWEKIVNHANKANPLVGSILEHGFLEETEPHKIIIGFKKKIHYDMAVEKQEKMAEIIKGLLQRDFALVFSLHNGTEPGKKTLTETKEDLQKEKKDRLLKEKLGNHVVQEALRIFKGKVQDVKDFGAES